MAARKHPGGGRKPGPDGARTRRITISLTPSDHDRVRAVAAGQPVAAWCGRAVVSAARPSAEAIAIAIGQLDRGESPDGPLTMAALADRAAFRVRCIAAAPGLSPTARVEAMAQTITDAAANLIVLRDED